MKSGITIFALNSLSFFIPPYRRAHKGPHPLSAVAVGLLISAIFILANWFLK